MVYVKNHSNTRTGTGHEPDMEAINISDDHEEGSQTCAGEISPLLTDGKRRSIAPTNYLRVSKRGLGVEGQYILDLSLPPPPSSAPGILADQDRKNLSLCTTSGPINTEIWIIHDGAMFGKPKRASMDLCTDNGVVRATVHDPSSTNGNSHARPAFDLNVRASYGDISVSLPRCFRGPITISTDDDRIAFSPALEEYMSLLSDVPGFLVYFVGERPLKGKWGSAGGTSGEEGEEDDSESSAGEPLDELSVGGRFSSVRINWDGEMDLPVMRPSGWQNFCGGTTRFFTSGRVC